MGVIWRISGKNNKLLWWFFLRNEQKCELFCLKSTTNHVKLHENTIGFPLKPPTWCFQSQFPASIGDGVGTQWGPLGFRGGGKPKGKSSSTSLLNTLLYSLLESIKTNWPISPLHLKSSICYKNQYIAKSY